MAYCINCGSKNEDSSRFCVSCGTPMANEANSGGSDSGSSGYSNKNGYASGGSDSQSNGFNFEDVVNQFKNPKDHTADYHTLDIENNKILSLFSYLGILFLIPMLAAPNSKFAKFHVNQGVLLLIAGIAISAAVWIVNSILLAISTFFLLITGLVNLLNLITLIFAIMGIVNSVSGKAKELPIIGGFRLIK